MTAYILAAILTGAVVTFMLRALPFLLFSGKREMPAWMHQLGKILPSAIMAVLIVYCLRGARSDFAGTGIPGLIAAAVVVLTYKWKHSTFISIVAGTAVYMALIRVM
ncbi:MAG: branched-chain amino acid permease [Lachnospiraceae bacterium]|nr:branched-chain amino acid permease [Lachnospiraceae bacterium]